MVATLQCKPHTADPTLGRQDNNSNNAKDGTRRRGIDGSARDVAQKLSSPMAPSPRLVYRRKLANETCNTKTKHERGGSQQPCHAPSSPLAEPSPPPGAVSLSMQQRPRPSPVDTSTTHRDKKGPPKSSRKSSAKPPADELSTNESKKDIPHTVQPTRAPQPEKVRSPCASRKKKPTGHARGDNNTPITPPRASRDRTGSSFASVEPEPPYSAHSTIMWASDEIEAFVATVDDEMAAMGQAYCKALQYLNRLVVTRWAHAFIDVYGSICTQLALPGSDLDCVIVVPEAKHGLSPIAMLREVHAIVVDQACVADVELVEAASIPVLKFVYRLGDVAVPMDISVAHSAGHSGLASRDLVKKFSEYMPALRPLALVLKAHLKANGLGCAFSGGLSSYALVVLIIRFLQCFGDVHVCHTEPPTPELARQPNTLYTFFRHDAVVWQGNIGMLLLMFLEQHMSFEFAAYGVSIANGGEYFALDDVASDASFAVHAHIVDPLSTRRVLGNSFRIHEIVRAWRHLHGQILVRAPLVDVLSS
ncbi:hypothetical protein SPRG_13382 [Saprolegnia parasitica CBS 223.65]|uniref:Poly(A) RNA polymerase mitochondrial-like central palm domain-containing protein n=1 Tax=Saprolegnia parasitica (strain CBS 223.65) TaxID=695850 RepID=A0A067C4U6_SAPPC|nr:hypothetical protein SPRG_13382 [Saprolegnia parasitica CBS 223.65]KDO21571.1 hypothetical protein SPRG_13382 [Saprolegnia parasitica CBS 223.65]|eukprot:XP_012207748.1 hypothetical protein SPRG_13382 [Saprolegnia parasitica CBS 223.65]